MGNPCLLGSIVDSFTTRLIPEIHVDTIIAFSVAQVSAVLAS